MLTHVFSPLFARPSMICASIAQYYVYKSYLTRCDQTES